MAPRTPADAVTGIIVGRFSIHSSHPGKHSGAPQRAEKATPALFAAAETAQTTG